MSTLPRDFSGLIEGGSKSIRSRTPTPSLLETGYTPSALRSRSRSSRPKSISRKRTASTSYLERIKRRPRLVITVVLTLLGGWIAWTWFLSDLYVLGRFKLKDRAYEEGWIKECGMRKKPLLFVRSGEEVGIVWEMSCVGEWEVRYGINEIVEEGSWRRRSRKKIKWEREIGATQVEVDKTHFVYQVILMDLKDGKTYTYELVRKGLGKIDEGADTRTKPAASYEFQWLGSSLSKSVPSTSSNIIPITPIPSTIHFAAISDNQYNIRIFHRILQRLISYGLSLPSSPHPAFLIHGGDNVQNPHNLAQWATDFWDPLTTLLGYNLGSQTPIVLARGNHDWDTTGKNVYTAGSPPRSDWGALTNEKGEEKTIRWDHPGTFYSYSPHERVRILVLDSNLVAEEDLKEQEEWLSWELGREEWKAASLKVVLVHVAPFLEFWDKEAWTTGGESQWSIYVRTRLTPLLSTHRASLVLSGHSHSYSRGFLPASLHRSYTSASNSSSLPPFALATAKERGWEKSLRNGVGGMEGGEEGTVYVIFGGAGGTLDREQVEDWGFAESRVTGKYHFAWGTLVMGRGEEATLALREREKTVKVNGGKLRVYEIRRDRKCEAGKVVVWDSLEWSAIGLKGKVFDRFLMRSEGCQ